VAVVAGVGPPDTPRFRDGLGPRERLTMTLATRARPLALVYWRLARRMLDRRPEAFVAEFEKKASEPDRAVLQNPDYRSTLIATSREALRAGAGGLVQDVAIQARPWGFRLEELTLPVRLWHGDQDQVVSLHHSQHVADAIPDAQLRTYEGEDTSSRRASRRSPRSWRPLRANRAGSPGRPRSPRRPSGPSATCRSSPN
jgi:pimeloyl-ACP methyl ester carboxylesterase